MALPGPVFPALSFLLPKTHDTEASAAPVSEAFMGTEVTL